MRRLNMNKILLSVISFLIIFSTAVHTAEAEVYEQIPDMPLAPVSEKKNVI